MYDREENVGNRNWQNNLLKVLDEDLPSKKH